MPPDSDPDTHAAVSRFLDRYFPVRDAARNRVMTAWPSADAFAGYYEFVVEVPDAVAEMNSIMRSTLTAKTTAGQPIVPLIQFPAEIGASGFDAAPWARGFLPRTRGSIVAYGKVRLLREKGVPVEYASALHRRSSHNGVAAEQIIALWEDRVPLEFAVELMK